MIKKVLGIVALSAILFSCGNKEQKKEETAGCDKSKTVLTVDTVLNNMDNFIGKDVLIAGTVNHVCAHGGKRMFIFGTDAEAAIKITPNDEIGIFEKELEGSNVLVTGIVKEFRIDEAYVVKLEKELAEDADNEAVHDHSGGTHDEEAENEKKAQINAIRAKIAESEKGYYSQFWIEASKFEVKECEHEHAEGEEHEHAEGEGHTH